MRRRRRRRRRARQRGRLGRRSRSLRHRRRASRRDAVRRATRAPGAGPEQPRVRPLVRRVPHSPPPTVSIPILVPFPATCACAWGCGERYCDERCRDEHALRGHRVLCVGPLDSWEHPIAALKLEAAQDEHGDGVLALVVEACADASPPRPRPRRRARPLTRTRRSTRSSPKIFTGSCAGRGGNTAAVDDAVRFARVASVTPSSSRRRSRRRRGTLSRRSEPFGARDDDGGTSGERAGVRRTRVSRRAKPGVRGGRIHGFVPGPRPGFELARG